MNATAYEVNFDGLVGPTHNYAGLALGNLASRRHGGNVSHPKLAALQGLAKMKFMADLGLKQAVLPPQPRPDLAALRRIGFEGDDAAVLRQAAREPRLLAAVYSASSMWAANAATVSPGADTADRRVHFTPANLISQFHRSIEPPVTAAILKTIFPDETGFVHHAPLPAAELFADEGAANHTRLCETYGAPGIEIFVHGRGGDSERRGLGRFPARQTLEASKAIARLHQLDPASVVFARQSAQAIDAGVFHNDVASVGNRNVMLYHALAYEHTGELMGEIRRKFAARCAGELHLIEVSDARISLNEAVQTYLFNSQLVSLPDGSMSLIAPVECRERANVAQFIDELIASDNPIQSAHFLDVRQSMNNGGGPACLRLRVVLTADELALVHPGVMLTDALHAKLTDWIVRHYRDELRPVDLADPNLALESRQALDELTRILGLDALDAFQQ